MAIKEMLVPTRFSQIMVPVDFSPNATLALETAVDIARAYQAKLTVVYVIPQAIFRPDWATDMEETLDIADMMEEARQALARTTEPYRNLGVPITEKVLAGGPYVEIVRLAQKLRTDLIVIGAHGTSGQKPLLMGSVAEKVVRQAPCAVLTVRTPHRTTT
jgi:nucleotide-binding universal stress UspA family protein